MYRFFWHYAHAIETRMFLLNELRILRKHGIVSPAGLWMKTLRSPTSSEDWIYFLRFIEPNRPIHLIDIGANTGYWAEEFMTIADCSECEGYRLKKSSLFFRVGGMHIGQLANMDLDKLYDWFDNVDDKLSDRQKAISKDVVKEIQMRLEFLLEVGLNYLTLNRQTRTLSGGESQRTRLATCSDESLQDPLDRRRWLDARCPRKCQVLAKS